LGLTGRFELDALVEVALLFVFVFVLDFENCELFTLEVELLDFVDWGFVELDVAFLFEFNFEFEDVLVVLELDDFVEAEVV
jgi:hypothetical protein